MPPPRWGWVIPIRGISHILIVSRNQPSCGSDHNSNILLSPVRPQRCHSPRPQIPLSFPNWLSPNSPDISREVQRSSETRPKNRCRVRLDPAPDRTSFLTRKIKLSAGLIGAGVIQEQRGCRPVELPFLRLRARRGVRLPRRCELGKDSDQVRCC